MRVVGLDEIARGTVAADGTCEVTIGPVSRQTWMVALVSVQCIAPAGVTDPASPTAKLYLGPSKQGKFIAGTYDGVNDSIPSKVTLPQGARVTVVWEEADPGGTCVVNVMGEMKVPT